MRALHLAGLFALAWGAVDWDGSGRGETVLPRPARGEAAAEVAAKRVDAGEGEVSWRLLYREDFDSDFSDEATPWTPDKGGKALHGRSDPFDDDGEFFRINGGGDFELHRKKAAVVRKSIPFGRDGWLTAELAAKDEGGKGKPESPPSIRCRGGFCVLDEPDHAGGILIRSTKPLPERYRVEVEFSKIAFGGSRGGKSEYGGRVNGYSKKGGKKSPYPWFWGDDISKPAADWPDIRDVNGVYYLSIVDYDNPAPHNNIFIHTHRKVVIDTYNVPGGGGWDYCDLAALKYARSQDNILNMIFLSPGSLYESKGIMVTDCGTAYGGEEGRTPYVGAAQMTMNGSYRFAVERDGRGYVLEAEGDFSKVGARKLRYRRDFNADGRALWHHNQKKEAYDGGLNRTFSYDKPGGKFSVESWPKGSAYPDYFILGDPHLNFYEGSAELAYISLYVPEDGK